MKKILLLLISTFFTTLLAYSQIENSGFKKSDIFINGTIGFQNTSYKNNNENTLSFSPKAGIFLTSNWLVGLHFGIGQKKITDSVVLSNISKLDIGTFTRYYFSPDKQFSVFTNIAFDYISENDHLTKAKVNKFEISISPGVHYFLSKDFLLEATIGKVSLGSSKSNIANASKSTNLDIYFQISSIELGLTYKISKK